MKLDVPYYSQFVDVQDSFWMLRACGMISLTMVSEFHGVQKEEILTLCEEALTRGGYDIENGWIHDYLVTKAKEIGLEAYRKEGLTDVQEIIASLDAGNPVIVSVEKRVLEQKRFHLIVLVGYDKSQIEKLGFEDVRSQEAKDQGVDLADNTQHADSHGQNSDSATSYKLQANGCFYYHEPESTDKEKGKFRSCDISTFMQYFRGKAIFISKKT